MDGEPRHDEPRRENGAAKWRRRAARLLRFLSRPVRRAQGRGGIVIEAYRGYGSTAEIFMIGRVFRQSAPEHESGDHEDLGAHLRDIGRRISRRKVAEARVTARFAGAQTEVVTDPDGYFRVHLSPAEPLEADRTWYPVDLHLHTEPPVFAHGQVFIPPASARYVVVSDIDDTVMHTGVANRAKMLWRLFVADAEDRVAFPGVAALYRALHGPDRNPILYVSRAPWGIYEMLTAFFRMHSIPVGPLLFLREWGISWRKPLPRRAEDHKRVLIEHMLAIYRDLPFILVGDSGQHDPEVYAQIVEAHPGRITAVYIRDVSRSWGRSTEIAHLAQAVALAGSRLLLAADSSAMARDAAEIGLIPAVSVAAVEEERREIGDETASPHRHRLDPARDTEELERLLAQDGPANVVLEPPGGTEGATSRPGRSAGETTRPA